MNHIEARSEEIGKLIARFSSTQSEKLTSLADQIATLFARGGQLLVAGGGQMQPLAQLLVSGFAFRLEFERPSLPAVAVGSDAILNSRLLAAGFYDQFLVRHYRCLTSHDHLVLLLSDGCGSSSLEMLRDEVAENDQPLALISARGEEDTLCCPNFAQVIDLGTAQVARQQELALFCSHLLCELVEKKLFGL